MAYVRLLAGPANASALSGGLRPANPSGTHSPRRAPRNLVRDAENAARNSVRDSQTALGDSCYPKWRSAIARFARFFHGLSAAPARCCGGPEVQSLGALGLSPAPGPRDVQGPGRRVCLALRTGRYQYADRQDGLHRAGCSARAGAEPDCRAGQGWLAERPGQGQAPRKAAAGCATRKPGNPSYFGVKCCRESFQGNHTADCVSTFNGCGSLWPRQAHDTPHLSPFVCNPSVGGWLRHPNIARVVEAQGSQKTTMAL